jgi:catechol 2,3-dioxygenase-like lactoylglutathione lyase family enzyme
MQPIAPIALRKAAVNTTEREGLPNVHGLHHWAFRCRDSEETRHFYEDILGLPLAAAVFHERVPSTQEYCPYYHIFFELADGSYIAFFDLLDGKAYAPDPDTPSWLHHMALEVDTRQSLVDAKARLEAAGVEVLGIVDHGWFDSIYFFDPNGMRMEFVHRKASMKEMKQKAQAARELLAQRPAKIAELRARAPA